MRSPPRKFNLVPLLLALVSAITARAKEEWPSIFDPFEVRTINIQIDAQKWEEIKRDTNFYDPALNIREPCKLWMTGTTPPNDISNAITVQIRRKSDPALPDEGNPQKVSLKIDVNEYVPGQNLFGIKKISLENGSGNGVLKEGFAMNLHKLAADAGFYDYQAFRSAWVRLVVNGQYVGLYTSPEQRDVTFLKNRGAYRPRASWLYEINGGIFRDDTVSTTDSPTHTHLNYLPFRSPNPPPTDFESDVQRWVDVRGMLTMAAIEAWMANTDGLFTKSASNQGKNSFCVDWLPSQQRRRFYLPWDMDGGFSNTSWDIFNGGSGSSAARQYQRRFLDHYWFGQVYRQLFSELLDGPMSAVALNAWLDQLEPILEPALAEDPNASSDFGNLRSFIAARNTNVRTQIGSIIQSPVLSSTGGEIAAGQPLAMTHANTTGTSTIYFTLDGTDPRIAGGAISPNAIAYTGEVTLNAAAHVTARIHNVNGATTNWSNVRTATFNIAGSLTSLRITEVMYHPKGDPASEDEDEFEFIELKNTGTAPLNLSGCRLDGVDFAFAPGTMVPAGSFLVLAANPSAFAQRYPSVAIHGGYFKFLSNVGERIRVVNSDGTTIDDVEYDANPPWPMGPDGLGYSLVRIGPGDGSLSWRASTNVHGSPGADDPSPPYSVGLVINEVLAKTNTPIEDAIEIFNPTPSPVDIGGWWLSDSYDPLDPARTSLKKYRIPSGTVVASGGFQVFYEVDFNPPAPTTNALEPFGLGQGGDAVYLSSADGAGNLNGHIIGQRFDASEDGIAQGRFTTSNGVDFTALAAYTFGVSNPASKAEFRTGAGAANAPARVSPVVFSEVMYQPAAGGAEFIELRNTTTASVNLEGWVIEGAGAFAFPVGAMIAAGSHVVVVDIATVAVSDFRSAYNVPSGVPVFGALFDLGDGGESLYLEKPNSTVGQPMVRVERVAYNDKAPWPVTASATGASIERINVNTFGNDPLNWRSTRLGGTPGRAPETGEFFAIVRGGQWGYHIGNRNLGSAWRPQSYRDDAWFRGAAPLGIGLPSLATILPYASPKPVTTYFRKDFSMPDPSVQVSSLTLLANYNDGFIAYLNGSEVARRSLPLAGVEFSTPASPHSGGGFETIDLTPYKSLLAVGKNTLSVELHLTASTDGDALWDAELTYAVSSTVPPDNDGDEMPDTWEVAHGLDPDDPADAALDLDADGQVNLAEYIAGTDPTNTSSVLRIMAIDPVDSGCRLTLATVAGRTYRIEYSSDFVQWFALPPDRIASGSTLQILDTPPGQAKRFYRARVVPAP